MIQKNSQRKVRGIYLLPNLLSMAGLFAAFYAIVAGLQGLYEKAAIAIFIAMIFDLFDGRVARMTQTESEFGKEFDSLCDMVSFGVAPALVVYSWGLQQLGKIGWLAAFIYTATAALRLARFNTQINSMDKTHFQGLPSPPAAGVVAAMVWYCQEVALSRELGYLAAFITVTVAVLMISNVRYYSFKTFNLRGKVPFVFVFLILLIYVAISLYPPMVLLIGFSVYTLSGVVLTLKMLRDARLQRKNKAKK